MHRKNQLFAKCASGILSFSLIMSMIPALPAWAEDNYTDEETAEEVALDTELEEEDLTSVFYITAFTGFEKDAEGHFTDEETAKKYGDLKAAPGTALDDLKLPEDLELEGYWESDGPDVPATLTLEEIDWKMKTDMPDEIYSESSPEGTYTFIPDYEAYVAQDESLDNIFLAEGVKDLTIDVQITSESESESETEAVTEAATEADTEAPSDVQTEPVTDSPADAVSDGDVTVPEATGDTSADTTADDGDINIFDQVDDSAIDASNQEEYKDSTESTESTSSEEDGTVVIPEQTETEAAAEEDTAASTEAPSEAATEAPTEAVTEASTEAPSENTAEISQQDALPSDGGATPVIQSDSVSGKLTFIDKNSNTTLAEYPADNTSLEVNADTPADVAVTLPCNAALDNLRIDFTLSDGSQTNYMIEDGTTDFGIGTAAVTFSAGTNSTYQINLTVSKEDHTSAGAATCTSPEVCSVCGTELTPALGHDWVPATCTTPKTCSRCNATEGTALGHDLRDDWETMEESTYSSHGYQERICHRDDCGYSETRNLNIIGNPEDNEIQNLSEGATYDINTRLTFSAYGAATENTDPIAQDVRYIPSSWSIQGTAGTWLDNYSGAFSISKTGTYTVTVNFQKQVYSDGSWQGTDVADSKSVTFSIGGASTDGSEDAVRINPQTGDQTPIIPLVIVLVVAAVVIIIVLVMRKKKK